MQFHQAKAELAYQESYAAVKYLLEFYDIDALRIIINGLSNGETLDTVFFQATGSVFSSFESEWTLWVKKNYKWYWLSELSDYLWIGILLLALLTFVAIRMRNRRTIKRWEEADEDEISD